MMTPATLWMFGLGPKPEQGLTVAPMPVFEKVYPVHRYAHEVDPQEHQCYGCNEVTEWICVRCQVPFCYEHAGHPTQFCENIGLCKSCADDRYSDDF